MRNDISIYLMAGVATAPHFMERFRIALLERLEQACGSVYSELLFPYGDWSRRIVPQLWEIRHDMRLSFRRLKRSIGGNRLLASIRPQLSIGRSHRTILIGHSGGGVAALHAAQLMLDEQIDSLPSLVVMIGSPRVRIPANLQSSVLSLYAAGKSRDIISSIGTFGGWSSGLRRFPTWQSNKHAPVNIQGLPIIGGHPDYFRERAPYMNLLGKSNLDISLEAIVSWLYPLMR